MAKQIIAVDIDDVLGDENGAMREFANKTFGLNHTPEDYLVDGEYWYYWEAIWKVGKEESHRRYEQFVAAKPAIELRLLPNAVEVITELQEKYELVVVTSRQSSLLTYTEEWLQRHFKKAFKDIHFVELWGGKSDKVTKAEICDEVGASYLVDDSPEHCQLAAEAGVTALLFGEYGWNRRAPDMKGMYRVKDWQAVREFFRERR